MSDSDLGYDYDVRKSGEVVITRLGKAVTTLRGGAAGRFLLRVEAGDPQGVMPSLTGNYKRGNERA